MAAAAAAAAGKKKGRAPRFVPKRGQVLKRVVAEVFAWLPRRCLLLRRNRAPRGRRGNRVPAGGGHVEPEPDVANNALAHARATTTANNNKPPVASYY